MTGRISILTLFLFVIVSVAGFAQTRTFSVSSEEVRVDVLVTDEGIPVVDLNVSDFEIYDNGVRQEIEYAKLQRHMPLSAMLVFDMSGSVVGELLADLKEAAFGLISEFHDEDRIALITFNHALVLGTDFTSDFSQVRSALEQTKPAGNSSLIDAGYAGMMLAKSGAELPLIIIFSDGFDTFSWLTEGMVLETAKSIDSVIYAVSIHKQTDTSFLRNLTELTGGTLFEVESTRDLASIFLDTLSEFRSRYMLAYTPKGVPESGWHELEVRVHRPSAKIRTRPGYMKNASVD
ncbi:MAG: VWA domain-containing protein [Acidobacteriota bacterium]|jgi:Ca-activated chloride channel family protein